MLEVLLRLLLDRLLEVLLGVLLEQKKMGHRERCPRKEANLLTVVPMSALLSEVFRHSPAPAARLGWPPSMRCLPLPVI